MNDRPLAPCPACRRHVADEPACPFCGTPLAITPTIRPTLSGRFSRAAVFAGATLVGCSSGSSSNESAPPSPAPPVARSDAPAPPPPPPLPDATTRARVVGRKLTFSGRPLKNSEVVLVDPEAAGKGSAGSAGSGSASAAGRRVLTDHDGNFAFDDLEPGDYLLQSPGAQHAIHLETGTNHVDFVMPKPPEPVRPPNMPYGAPPARYRIV